MGATAGASRSGGGPAKVSGLISGPIAGTMGGSGTPRRNQTPISSRMMKLKIPTWYAPHHQPALSSVETITP